jgi:hypothetical protein
VCTECTDLLYLKRVATAGGGQMGRSWVEKSLQGISFHKYVLYILFGHLQFILRVLFAPI